MPWDLLLITSVGWAEGSRVTRCNRDRIWSVVSLTPTQLLLIISTELRKSNLCGHCTYAKPIHLFRRKSFMLATQEDESSNRKNS